MKFLNSIVAILLLQGGNAFSAQNLPSRKAEDAPTSASSRKDFLELTSAAAFASLVGAVASPEKCLAIDVGGKIRYAGEDIMTQKAHGTSAKPVQEELMYGANNKLADKICNFNRHFAEMGGYFQSTSFEEAVMNSKEPITFYDSVTGKALFVAPINRSSEQFIAESKVHGWPSFRDEEVVWENVRVLSKSGETVSVDGTHLGHNLPDRSGNRYCINLVSIAGSPIA